MTEQKSKKESLLRCPFCGGEAEMVGDEDDGWIECKKCGARVDFSKSRISQNWNTRKPIERALERLKKKEEEYFKEFRTRGHEELYGASWGFEETIDIITEEVG